MRRFLWIAVILGSVLLMVLSWGSGHASDVLVRDDGRTRGNPQAPITLVEYSDFTCGFCVKFFWETWPRIREKYIETGKVRFLYRDFPRALQGPGVDAAVASRCAGDQGRYWQMHDRLFTNGGRFDEAAFQHHAKAIGLDQPLFMKCREEARHRGPVFQDRSEGVRLGFRGTPGFVLLRTKDEEREKESPIVLPGAFPFEVFEAQLDRLLGASDAKGKS
ncbi:MAG: DsbA family protein [Nitrospiraceae bacterium]